jgi:hypothetical protein
MQPILPTLSPGRPLGAGQAQKPSAANRLTQATSAPTFPMASNASSTPAHDSKQPGWVQEVLSYLKFIALAGAGTWAACLMNEWLENRPRNKGISLAQARTLFEVNQIIREESAQYQQLKRGARALTFKKLKTPSAFQALLTHPESQLGNLHMGLAPQTRELLNNTTLFAGGDVARADFFRKLAGMADLAAIRAETDPQFQAVIKAIEELPESNPSTPDRSANARVKGWLTYFNQPDPDAPAGAPAKKLSEAMADLFTKGIKEGARSNILSRLL